MKERGISFKEAVNSAVRTGLSHGRAVRGRFRQTTYSLGGDRNFRWDKALETAASIEDEESGRKLSVRK